jgi:hypothetical protein
MLLPNVPLDVPTPDPALPLVPQAALTSNSMAMLMLHMPIKSPQALLYTTGYVFLLPGGIVAYHSKTQYLTATSSTEAKFIAAVSSGKVAK